MQCLPLRRRWRSLWEVLRSAAGAFDLPSILVGVATVGILTAGVLVVVFGVIPFAQDKSASQDLSSVTTAQGVSKAKDGRYQSLASLGAVPLAAWISAGTAGPEAAYPGPPFPADPAARKVTPAQGDI